ncbi:MAG: YigZ family protein [Clostridiales bacterium]|nr:YigZ family protein [Clostridiales bacterium]
MGYKAVDKEFEELIVIQKSKFITTLVPITSQEDAIEKLNIIKKKYSDATHNCYAYISSENAIEQRFSDDGEPQGTAGVPMLEVLKKRGVYMTLCVVTRYFGGIKLGANGLIGAYSSCVASAIDKAEIVEYKISNSVDVDIDYSIYKKVQEAIEKSDGQVQNVEYNDSVKIQCIIPVENYENAEKEIINITSGQAKIVIKNTKYNKFVEAKK